MHAMEFKNSRRRYEVNSLKEDQNVTSQYNGFY